jgi:uncharacterized phage protein (predicted DNA packaging)
MMICTLDEVKQHLRIVTADDDALLSVYAEAAERYVNDVTGEVLSALQENPMAKAAVLLIVGDLYENREGSSEVQLKENPTVDRLLWPLRVW